MELLLNLTKVVLVTCWDVNLSKKDANFLGRIMGVASEMFRLPLSIRAVLHFCYCFFKLLMIINLMQITVAWCHLADLLYFVAFCFYPVCGSFNASIECLLQTKSPYKGQFNKVKGSVCVLHPFLQAHHF